MHTHSNTYLMTAAVEKETGMLDVGTHCAFCRQMDFLPFHCKYCGGDFCASHRLKEAHHCSWLIENEKKKPVVEKSSTPTDNGGKYFQSLLPDKGYIRIQNGTAKKAEETLKVHTSSARSTVSKTALDKLTRFFKKRESKKTFFSKKAKSKPSNKIIQLANLKRIAKGDSSIPITNRLYLYCYVIDNEDEDDPKEHEIFINRVWPIGRALDSIAKQLNLRNQNNDFRITADQKLYLYRKKDDSGEVQPLLSSNRVATDIKELDTLYLVRGGNVVEQLPLV